MSVGADLDVDLSGAVGLNITGIPNDFSVRIKELPKIQLGVDPVDLSLRLKEIPSIRVHFPVNFKVGFSFFGAEFFGVRLCGHGQIITEPYVPNPCECPNPKLSHYLPHDIANLKDMANLKRDDDATDKLSDKTGAA